MKSDVIVGEVTSKSTNQEACISVTVKEATCDLVEEGVGEGVGVEGEEVSGALSFNE